MFGSINVEVDAPVEEPEPEPAVVVVAAADVDVVCDGEWFPFILARCVVWSFFFVGLVLFQNP